MRLTWRTFPLFFWGQFLTGFCFHLVLPAVLLLLAGLVLGVIGVRFGLYYLVWNENPFKQAIVGFAVFLLGWEVLLVGYLLEAQRTPHADRFRFKRGGPALAYLVGIVLSSLLILAVIFALHALAHVIVPPPTPLSSVLNDPEEMDFDMPFLGLPFVGGAIVAVTLGVYFTSLRWIDPASRPFMTRVGATIFRLFARFPMLGVRKPDDADLYLHGVAAMSWLVAFVFFFALDWAPWFSPIVGICFLLQIIIAIFAFLAYFLPRLTPLILVLLLGLLWLGGMPRYKQRFPGLERHYDNPVSLGDKDLKSPNPPLLTLDEIDFCGRKLGKHEPNMKRPVVVVCASGGGLRAAAWTLAVLQELEDRLKPEDIRFPYHIRLMNGASGGMLGLSCYALSVPNPDAAGAATAPGDLRKQLTQDSLSPVVHQLAYGDVGSMFLPWSRGNDRGRALERAWNENLNGLLDVSFGSLREQEKAGWRPSLVFSPMLVEDGRRLLISNLDLDDVARNRTNVVPGASETLLSIGAVELFRLYPDPQTRQDFKVVTAARMSASFPYVAPAVSLPTLPRRRVVDAGYFDNYGVSLPSSWLMSRDTMAWIRKNASGVLLVQIRDSQDEKERKLEGVLPDTSKPLSRGLEELTSPPEGLVTGQDSAAVFRNDEQLEMIGRLLAHEVKQDANFFSTVTLEFKKKASLSWYLTPAEQKRIEDQAQKEVEKHIQKVAAWWKSRPDKDPVK